MIVAARFDASLELARARGADLTVKADGAQVARIKERTGGAGCEAVFDFVAKEINYAGSLVGTLNELVELMTLNAQRRLTPLSAANSPASLIKRLPRACPVSPSFAPS